MAKAPLNPSDIRTEPLDDSTGATKMDPQPNRAPTGSVDEPWTPRPIARPHLLESGLALLDTHQHVISFSTELADWFGVAQEEVRGKDFGTLFATRLPECAQLWNQIVAGGEAVTQQEFKQVRNGVTEHLRLETAKNPAGWFVRFSSVLPSSAELIEEGYQPGEHNHRQLFLRLLRAESRFDNLLQRWPGVIFTQRADYSFQYASPGITALTGVAPEEWRRQPQKFWQVVHEADVEELRHQCTVAAQRPEGVSTTFRVRHLQTGQITYLLEHRKAITSRSGLILSYEGVWLDITRQTIAEKRLSSAAWKDTLATLTVGLAHDFGNIMSGILSLSELFLAQAGTEHPFYDGLGMIKQHSMQATQLIQRMVNLHRCKTGERNYHNLNELVADIVELMAKVLPRRIQIKLDLASDPLPVYMDGVEFRQVVINLALNAADAMPQRGVLTLRTRRFTEPQTFTNNQGAFPRLPCACLSVIDNGCGIPVRNLPFLFDAFFTTKPVNKGSGLGLYNTRLFTEKHGGAISVESEVNAGTTMNLWLPEADFTENERQQLSHRTRRRVLLLGEPGLLTESMAESLRVHDYYVVVTNGPERGKELLVSEEAGFHGLLLLIRPGEPVWKQWLQELPAVFQGKIAVQLVSGHEDEMDQAILEKAQLVVRCDMGEAEMIQRFDSLFA